MLTPEGGWTGRRGEKSFTGQRDRGGEGEEEEGNLEEGGAPTQLHLPFYTAMAQHPLH